MTRMFLSVSSIESVEAPVRAFRALAADRRALENCTLHASQHIERKMNHGNLPIVRVCDNV